MLSYHVRCEAQNRVFGPMFQRHVKQPVTHYSIAAAKAGAIVLDITEAGIGRSGESAQDSGGNNEQDCLFQVGSVSKIITGALMVKLLESGEVTLADPVERFMPEWKLEGVEIGHLLTHTSGIDDTCLHMAWPKKGEKQRYYSGICRLARLAEKPGAISRYNTHAYALLA